MQYREGLNVGYRFHDTYGVPARFAFGHGLGYTTFAFGEQVTGSGTTSTVGDWPIPGPGPGPRWVEAYVADLE